jgi:transposase
MRCLRRRLAESEAKFRALLIERLKYTIAKLRREQYGQSSERVSVLDQLELQLSELPEDSSEADAAAQLAAARAQAENPDPANAQVRSIERRKPARRPLPEQLPRERIVYPVPSACPCCDGVLHKLGEDVTATLELIPRQWKVIQHVRENSPAGRARRSPSRLLPRIRSRVDAPAPGFWLMCCSASTACICRSIGRARPTRAKASSSMSQCSPTGWARQQRR